MESFKDYRFRLGLVGKNVDPKELHEARKTYRKSYLEKYRKTRTTNVIRREITLTPTEDQKLSALARKQEQSPSRFIKACALSFAGEAQPNIHAIKLSDLLYQIRKIGVNINQMAFMVNRDGAISFDHQQVNLQLMALENIILASLGGTNTTKHSIRSKITQTLSNGH